MNAAFLRWLQCPLCSGPLQASDTRLSDEPGYTVLSCHCGRYPVVAGIPILTHGVISAGGHTTDEVIGLLEAGRRREALLALLMPAAPSSAALAPAWLQALPSVPGMDRLQRRGGQPALRAWQQRTEAFLTGLGAHVPACQLFDFYFKGGGSDRYTHHTYCFGQPRHLVALSLASLIHQPHAPILDLGCGCGLITRSLLPRASDQPVIGVDHSFVSLYIAKGWLAPQADYVCSAADVSLPFPAETFATAFCSNAFQLFEHKATCVRELQRVTCASGLVILVSVRNRLVKPQLYAHPSNRALPPAGYATLLADLPHRLVRNTDVLTRYLQKQGPALADATALEDLKDEQWLSVVASQGPEWFQDYGAFKDWPHAAGQLAINPLYRQERREANGTVHLRHVWPSAWYAQENEDCRLYQPETVALEDHVLRDIAQGQRTAAVDRLLAQCVVVGLPERFR